MKQQSSSIELNYIDPCPQDKSWRVRYMVADKFTEVIEFTLIDHFTVVCLVTWPLNESETGVDCVLIETSLLFFCKFLTN